MNISKKINKYFIIMLLILSLTNCQTDNKKHIITSRPKASTKNINTTAQAISKRGISKTTSNKIIVTNFDQNYEELIKKLLANAKNLIIIAETNPPDWLQDYLNQLSKNNFLLRILLLINPNNAECEYSFCAEILNLKASFIIIDKKTLILNPIYDSSDRGIIYIIHDPLIISKFLKYSINLIELK